jgi:fucose permease
MSLLLARFSAFASSDRGAAAILYWSSFAGLGLCLSILGPVLLGLAIQTNSTLRDAGYCFIVRSLGYALGSMGGTLYDRLPGHYVLGSAMLLSAVGTAAIPLVRSVYLLGTAVMLQGIAMGFCDTGSNVMIIWWYKQDVGPYMQALHFAFALGATLGPLLLRLVALLETGGGQVAPGDEGLAADGGARVASTDSYASAFYMIAIFNAIIGGFFFVKPSPKPRVDSVAAAVAAPAAVASAPGVALHVDGAAPQAVGEDRLIAAEASSSAAALDWAPLADPGSAGGLEAAAAAADESSSSSSASPSSPPVPAGGDGHGDAPVPAHLSGELWRVVAVVASLLFLYVGAETGYGAFITSYTVVALGTTEATGQLMTGAYWGALCVGRFLSIFVAMKFHPATYLGASMGACCVAAVFLLLFPASLGALWAGSVAYGLGMACIFPTAIALAETYFPVQGKHATAFVVGGAIGEMALPFVIATLFGGEVDTDTGEARKADGGGPGPAIMLYVVCAATLVNMIFYFLLVKMGKRLHARIQEARGGDGGKTAAAVAPGVPATADALSGPQQQGRPPSPVLFSGTAAAGSSADDGW